jgi:hypothetical protein
LEAVEVKFESYVAAVELKFEPAEAKPEPAPSKYSIIFRALLPAPDANIAIWTGAADAVEGAATDFPEGSVVVESKVEPEDSGAATDFPEGSLVVESKVEPEDPDVEAEPPNPNTFTPTRLKYPLKKRNCPVKKLTKSTEKGHKMVKNRG